MTHEMKLPELGENIETAEVVSILVAVGDQVTEDQPIIELETDKATAEVPASRSGVVKQVHVKEGEKIAVGQVILTVDDSGSPAASEVKKGKEKAKARPSGGAEKARAEPKPAGKKTAPARKGTSSAAPAGAPAEEKTPVAPVAAAATPAPPTGGLSAPASPSVRRLARELGVDIGAVRGSGSGGRVSDDDVKAHVKAGMSALSSGGGATETPALPDFSSFGEVERESLTGIRRATSAGMSRSWRTIPHVTQHDRADVTELEAFRKAHGPSLATEGIRLTVTSILVKIAAAALQVFPRFNSSLDDARGELVLKKYTHIGVAVDTERGLLVPVIRDVDTKSLRQVSRDLAELAEKARNRKANMADLSGASFTVTNLGGLGTTEFSPIVNWPEVAILGLGRARHEAVWQDGEFRPRLIMPLSLSYDHRVIDGADAARFLRWIGQAIENPLLMLLDA